MNDTDDRPIHGRSHAAQEVALQLQGSELFRKYAFAFRRVTGLPVGVAVGDIWWSSDEDRSEENPFFRLMASHRKACKSCRCVWNKGIGDCEGDLRTMVCVSGICESRVAILQRGDSMIYLRTGATLFEPPTLKRFEKIKRHLVKCHAEFVEPEMRDAYLNLSVIDLERYQAMLVLLEFFARQLAMHEKGSSVRGLSSENPNIRRACQFVMDHLDEPLTLSQVAGVANMSSYYFCRKFKEATNFTFTEYVSRIRIEGAKERLQEARIQVSEVAFESGFRSVAHFNRSFKTIVGCSPKQFRGQM